MKDGWQRLPFDEVVSDESGGSTKTPRSEFLPIGQLPIVDQGKALVSGYTNDSARVCKAQLPVIIFGDHTRCFKFVDFPFGMGADGVKVLRPRSNVDEKYLFHFLCSLQLPNAGYDRHFKYLKRTEIVLPPTIAEQKRIAAILDKAEELRRLRRKALEQMDALAQSIFLEMFGDPATNSKNWQKCLLTELCSTPDDIKCGPFGTQLNCEEYQDSGVPLWGIKHVNAHFSIRTQEFISENKAKDLAAYSLQPGDIVMTRKGTIGNCAVYPKDFDFGIMHSDLLRVRVSTLKANSAFLSHQLHYSRDVEHQLSLIGGGAIMPGINVTKLKGISIVAPPLPLQQEFARRVEAIEQLKAAHRESLAHLDALFASLQHRAFRGEL